MVTTSEKITKLSAVISTEGKSVKGIALGRGESGGGGYKLFFYGTGN